MCFHNQCIIRADRSSLNWFDCHHRDLQKEIGLTVKLLKKRNLREIGRKESERERESKRETEREEREKEMERAGRRERGKDQGSGDERSKEGALASRVVVHGEVLGPKNWADFHFSSSIFEQALLSKRLVWTYCNWYECFWSAFSDQAQNNGALTVLFERLSLSREVSKRPICLSASCCAARNTWWGHWS